MPKNMLMPDGPEDAELVDFPRVEQITGGSRAPRSRAALRTVHFHGL
jgi:hypothetical protein